MTILEISRLARILKDEAASEALIDRITDGFDLNDEFRAEAGYSLPKTLTLKVEYEDPDGDMTSDAGLLIDAILENLPYEWFEPQGGDNLQIMSIKRVGE